MHLIPVVVVLVVLAVGLSEGIDIEALDRFVCTQDETIRSNVMQCMEMVPMSHFEIIKRCNSVQLGNIGNDRSRLLDFFCSEGEAYGQSESCVTEAYTNQGMSLDEVQPMRPSEECVQRLMVA